jgi:hypothetical protein
MKRFMPNIQRDVEKANAPARWSCVLQNQWRRSAGQRSPRAATAGGTPTLLGNPPSLKLWRDKESLENMCFCETNPPFWRTFFCVSLVYQGTYVVCRPGLQVGSFWKTNPKLGGYEVVFIEKWVRLRKSERKNGRYLVERGKSMTASAFARPLRRDCAALSGSGESRQPIAPMLRIEEKRVTVRGQCVLQIG